MNGAECLKRLLISFFALTNGIAVAAFGYFFFSPIFDITRYSYLVIAILLAGAAMYFVIVFFTLSLCAPCWAMDFERTSNFLFSITITWLCGFLASLLQAYWMLCGIAFANTCVYFVVSLMYMDIATRKSSDVEENMEEMPSQPVVE